MTSRPSHHALWTHSVHVIRSTEQSCGRGEALLIIYRRGVVGGFLGGTHGFRGVSCHQQSIKVETIENLLPTKYRWGASVRILQRPGPSPPLPQAINPDPSLISQNILRGLERTDIRHELSCPSVFFRVSEPSLGIYKRKHCSQILNNRDWSVGFSVESDNCFSFVLVDGRSHILR